MFKTLLLPALLVYSFAGSSQVCPTSTFSTQYNQVTNLGGAAENPQTTPFTYAYTAGAGLNRLMLIFVTYETENVNGPNNFAAATYGGVAMTNVINQTISAAGTQQNRLAVYYLKEAGIIARVGNNVSVTFTNPGGTSPNGSINGVAVNTLLFENVDQVTSLLNLRSNTNMNTVTINVPASFTATAGNYVIAAVNMALATATVGPATPDYTVYISQQVAGSHTHSVSYKKIVTTGNEQPGFTANVSTRQIIGSVEVKAFSVGGSCTGGIVPVHIFGFTGAFKKEGVLLSWNVGDELNVKKYNIQRSADGVNGFNTIGDAAAVHLPAYHFIDQYPLPGMSYYRIQSEDEDGSVEYSNIIRINNTIKHLYTVNTLTGGMINVVSQVSHVADLSLYDVSGRRLWSRSVLLHPGSNKMITGHLPASLYFLQISASGGSQIFSFLNL